MNTHNVTMPSGIVINDVPVNYSKQDLVNKLLANGYTLQQLGLDTAPAVKAEEDKSTISYAVQHPEEAFGELGKDMLLGLVGTRDKADWEHPLNYLSPWANKEAVSAQDVHNAEQVQKRGKEALGAAAYATGAGVMEAVPAIAAIGEEAPMLAKAGKFLLTNGAGSVASQEVQNGDVSVKQVAEDVALGKAGEVAGNVLLVAPAKQAAKLFSKISEAFEADKPLTEEVADYLGASRTYDLAKDYVKLKAKNPNATLLDAYNNLYEQSPGLYNDVDSVGRLKQFTRKIKQNVDPDEFLDYALENKMAHSGKLKESISDQKLATDVLRQAENAEAFKGNLLTGKMKLDNDLVEATPIQRLGDFLGDKLGANEELAALSQRRAALKSVKPDVDNLLKQLEKDRKEAILAREKLVNSGKTGTHITSHKKALQLQAQSYKNMIKYLKEGLEGKPVRLNDFATAIHEAQQSEFGNKSSVKAFSDMAERLQQMSLLKIEGEEKNLGELTRQLTKWGGKKVIGAVLGHSTAGASVAAATVAGRMAQSAKASAMRNALKLNRMVQSGDLTEEEAEQYLIDYVKTRMQATEVLRDVAGTSTH